VAVLRVVEAVPHEPSMVALGRGSFGGAVALRSLFRNLAGLRIDRVTSSAASARNQMKRVGLFARYGIIGLALDDVPGVRA